MVPVAKPASKQDLAQTVPPVTEAEEQEVQSPEPQTTVDFAKTMQTDISDDLGRADSQTLD